MKAIRLRTPEGMYLFEARGVVFATFVSSHEIERAMQLMITETQTQELWTETLSDLAGITLIPEPIPKDQVKKLCHYCGNAEAVGKTKRAANICSECAGPRKFDKAYIPWSMLRARIKVSTENTEQEGEDPCNQ